MTEPTTQVPETYLATLIKEKTEIRKSVAELLHQVYEDTTNAQTRQSQISERLASFEESVVKQVNSALIEREDLKPVADKITKIDQSAKSFGFFTSLYLESTAIKGSFSQNAFIVALVKEGIFAAGQTAEENIVLTKKNLVEAFNGVGSSEVVDFFNDKIDLCKDFLILQETLEVAKVETVVYTMKLVATDLNTNIKLDRIEKERKLAVKAARGFAGARAKEKRGRKWRK